MSSIAGIVVHARAGRGDEVRALLEATPELETVAAHGASFAVVLEADRPSAQEAAHERLRAHAAVESVELVFQSAHLEESWESHGASS